MAPDDSPSPPPPLPSRPLAGEFTVPAVGMGGERPNADDDDPRAIHRGKVNVAILPGIGGRASLVRAVAKRAKIPTEGYAIPFAVRLESEVRPAAPTLELRSRTPYDFTVTWQPPVERDGDGDGEFAEVIAP